MFLHVKNPELVLLASSQRKYDHCTCMHSRLACELFPLLRAAASPRTSSAAAAAVRTNSALSSVSRERPTGLHHGPSGHHHGGAPSRPIKSPASLSRPLAGSDVPPTRPRACCPSRPLSRQGYSGVLLSLFCLSRRGLYRVAGLPEPPLSR